LPSQLSISYNLHRKRRRKHRARARARTKSSRTKRGRGRDLLKVTFNITNTNYKRKIVNNLQKVDKQNALF